MVHSYTKVFGFKAPLKVIEVEQIEDGTAIKIGIPNLDAEQSSNDLLLHAAQLRYLAEQYRLLECYARAKAGAVYNRQQGSIARAQYLEGEAEEIYETLDPAFRW